MGPFLETRERMILIRDGYYSASPRASRRAAMLLALDRGMTAAAVARAVRCSRTLVYYWLHRYLDHRNVSVLYGGQMREKATLRSRWRAVNRILGGKGHRLGCLPKIKGVREMLWLEACLAPDPAARLHAAVLLALDRGAPIQRVALAAGRSRQAVYQAWSRLLAAAPSRPDGVTKTGG